MVGGYASLNGSVFNWLSNPIIVFCDRTDCRSLFQSIAKPHLPMAFLGQTEERESRFPEVRLLDLIKVDKYEGWENLIALNVIRLHLNRLRYEMGSQYSFCR